jgi:hypothetical protein
LIAAALGDVGVQYVWRFLRAHKIDLAARKSWCESNDPAFAAKAAAVVGLYMKPPENALVFAVDLGVTRVRACRIVRTVCIAPGQSTRLTVHEGWTVGIARLVQSEMAQHFQTPRRTDCYRQGGIWAKIILRTSRGFPCEPRR